MPIYVYKCQKCGYKFEELVRNKQDIPEKCPKCGGNVRRVFSGTVGLQFKGSGFYITDYKKSNNSPSRSNDK